MKYEYCINNTKKIHLYSLQRTSSKRPIFWVFCDCNIFHKFTCKFSISVLSGYLTLGVVFICFTVTILPTQDFTCYIFVYVINLNIWTGLLYYKKLNFYISGYLINSLCNSRKIYVVLHKVTWFSLWSRVFLAKVTNMDLLNDNDCNSNYSTLLWVYWLCWR